MLALLHSQHEDKGADQLIGGRGGHSGGGYSPTTNVTKSGDSNS